MAAAQPPMGPTASFVYLVDNIPVWQSQMAALSVHAGQKNAEFVAEYARLVKQARPKGKRVKSPSVSSIHSDKDQPKDDDGHDPPPSPAHAPVDPSPTLSGRVEIDPLEAGNKDLYAEVRRKRKPENSIRSGASGPQKFRSKRQVVIYYDSHLQEQLDSLVKAVGLARNNLRKGRNALTAAKGFQLPTLARRYDYTADSLDHIRSAIVSRKGSALMSDSKYSRGSRSQPVSDDEAAFVQADKELEAIQSLCETAAHQFLRDGDCRTELDTILQTMNTVLAQATSAVELLQKLEESKAKEKELAADDANDSVTSSDRTNTDSDATLSTQPSLDILNDSSHGADASQGLPPAPRRTVDGDTNARGGFTGTLPVSKVCQPAIMTTDIEVDDTSDQSSINVDISKFRMTKNGETPRLRRRDFPHPTAG